MSAVDTCPESTRLVDTPAHPRIKKDKGAEGEAEKEEGGELVEREVLEEYSYR